MRNIWKGAISFGLVHVPVKLYTATDKKDISFNLLHNECKTPIKYRRHCPVCEEDVANEEIVKGFEYQKGRYVIIKDEDLENIPLETTKSVEILDFVDLEEIDPVFFDKSYYLAPGDGGEKAYELLKKAMQETNKIAIAKVVLRSRENLAVLRVYKNIIVMETMFYPDEIRPPEIIPELSYDVKLHENEIKMAESLINNLSDKFEPAKYTNNYRDALMEVIQAKITGEEIEVAPRPDVTKVVDLMDALKASIEMAKKQKDKPKEEKAKKGRKRKETKAI